MLFGRFFLRRDLRSLVFLKESEGRSSLANVISHTVVVRIALHIFLLVKRGVSSPSAVEAGHGAVQVSVIPCVDQGEWGGGAKYRSIQRHKS